MITKKLSPSRQYVAVCNNINGYYLKSFEIPADVEDTVSPSWYFTNELNCWACLQMVMTREEYNGMTGQSTPQERFDRIEERLSLQEAIERPIG